MKKLLNEINIVLVSKNKIDSESLDRDAIKREIKGDYDSPPIYMELPGVSIFDYFQNPEFPIQLNIQDNKIVFILRGNLGYDLEDIKNLNNFSSKFLEIIKVSKLKEKDFQVKALGMNAIIAIVPRADEQPFQSLMSNFKDILSDQGDFHAGGLKLLRRNGNKRLEINVQPLIPEMGNDFTDAYTVGVNEHTEPTTEDWEKSLVKSFKSFQERSLTIIDELNK